MALLSLATLTAALLADCAPVEASSAAPIELDQLVIPAGAPGCELGEPLQRILGGLADWDEASQRNVAGPPLTITGLTEPVVPRLQTRSDGYLHAGATVPARWRGLRITGVETVFMPESDDISNFILFAETHERVQAALIENGFRILPGSDPPELVLRGRDAASSFSLYVEARDSGSAVQCVENY